MAEEKKPEGEGADKKCCHHHGSRNAACGGALYGLGLIGAAIYYIQHAGSFSAGLVGFLKALVWPAFVVYKLLEFLKM